MIESFKNKLARDLFEDNITKETKSWPSELRRAARRKLLYLHDAAALSDLKVPPGNRLKPLKGDYKGYYSIRINDQWRLIFKWSNESAFDVAVLDYH